MEGLAEKRSLSVTNTLLWAAAVITRSQDEQLQCSKCREEQLLSSLATLME